MTSQTHSSNTHLWSSFTMVLKLVFLKWQQIKSLKLQSCTQLLGTKGPLLSWTIPEHPEDIVTLLLPCSQWAYLDLCQLFGWHKSDWVQGGMATLDWGHGYRHHCFYWYPPQPTLNLTLACPLPPSKLLLFIWFINCLSPGRALTELLKQLKWPYNCKICKKKLCSRTSSSYNTIKTLQKVF